MSLLPKDSYQSFPEGCGEDAEDWECRELLGKRAAEELLDWLEANGYSQRKVSIAEDGTFTVYWRR